MNFSYFYPLFALVLLTFAVMLLMLKTRIQAVRNRQLHPGYFKTFASDKNVPDAILKTQRHFTNLFELPVLFYVACLIAMILPLDGAWGLFWAWLFVAARLAHAVIHLGRNSLYPRMASYGIGWLAVLGFWFTLFLKIGWP